LSPRPGEEPLALKALAKEAGVTIRQIREADARGELKLHTRGNRPRTRGLPVYGYLSDVVKWKNGGLVVLVLLLGYAALVLACRFGSETAHDALQWMGSPSAICSHHHGHHQRHGQRVYALHARTIPRSGVRWRRQ